MRDKIIRYLEHYRESGDWFFVTRSIRNDMSLQEAFNDLRVAQNRFTVYARDEKRHPWNNTKAWIAVSEITYSSRTGYNLHQHALVSFSRKRRKGWKRSLYDTWNKSAGYSAVFNIQELIDPERAAAYISKYMSKATWGGLSRGRSYLCRDTLKGRNRITRKRGTGSPKLKSDFILCCLPPSDYCSHPNQIVRQDLEKIDQILEMTGRAPLSHFDALK